MHSRSRPRSPEAVSVDELRRRVGQIDRRLVVVNAACFTSLVALAGFAPGLLAVEVVGRINVGLILCAGVGVLTLCLAGGYDRRLGRTCDPEAQQIRERVEARAAAAAEAKSQAAAQQWGARQGRGAGQGWSEW